MIRRVGSVLTMEPIDEAYEAWLEADVLESSTQWVLALTTDADGDDAEWDWALLERAAIRVDAQVAEQFEGSVPESLRL